MTDDQNTTDTEAQRQALEAWQNLPGGTPSRQSLPPAGDGLGSFFRLFARIVAPLRENKRLTAFGFMLVTLVGIVVWVWR